VILLDASGLLSALDSSQTHHEQAAASLTSARPPLLLSPLVLAELDYLIASRIGFAARASLLEEVKRGAPRRSRSTGPCISCLCPIGLKVGRGRAAEHPRRRAARHGAGG
jgi:predicted nucleic acid-binding protein